MRMMASMRLIAPVLILVLLMIPQCGSTESIDISTTRDRIIYASSNSVWLVYSDPNTTHGKPAGVEHPDNEASALYILSMGIVLGMQANPQHETVDTDGALFDTISGCPIVHNSTFVLMAPPTVQAQLAYYESNRISPVYLSGNDSTVFWMSADNKVIPDTAVERVSLTDSSDLFLLEVFLDPQGNYIFAGYGTTPKGTFAAATLYKKIISSVQTPSESWSIYRWVDEGNTIPDSEDEYLILSKGSYSPGQIPESDHPILSFIVGATLVLLFLKGRKRTSNSHHAPMSLGNPFQYGSGLGRSPIDSGAKVSYIGA